MKTQVLSLDTLQTAADLLKRKEVVAFPTETVYGLGALIFEEEAIKKIYKIKGRPSDNPLIAHISSIDELQLIAVDIPHDFYKLSKAFFPGPLTVILKRHPNVPSIVSAGLATIAVRMPSHPIAQKLIALCKQPIVAPSANLSGKPSATASSHVLDDFEGKIEAVIDGGPCQIGIESTVIHLPADRSPIIMRPGAVTKEQIEEVLGKKVDIYSKDEKLEVVSPGMKYRHYAPDACIQLFYSKEKLIEHLKIPSDSKRMLLSCQLLEKIEGCDQFLLSAQALFSLLRKADAEGYQEIVVYCDESILNKAGLMNRLIRASQS